MTEHQLKAEIVAYLIKLSIAQRGRLLTDWLMDSPTDEGRLADDNIWKILVMLRERYRLPDGSYAPPGG